MTPCVMQQTTPQWMDDFTKKIAFIETVRTPFFCYRSSVLKGTAGEHCTGNTGLIKRSARYSKGEIQQTEQYVFENHSSQNNVDIFSYLCPTIK